IPPASEPRQFLHMMLAAFEVGEPYFAELAEGINKLRAAGQDLSKIPDFAKWEESARAFFLVIVRMKSMAAAEIDAEALEPDLRDLLAEMLAKADTIAGVLLDALAKPPQPTRRRRFFMRLF